MDTTSAPPPKKGIGVFGWLGIGCGGLVLLLVIAGVVLGFAFRPAFQKFKGDWKENPTRALATSTISLSAGQFEMVAEDDVNKRYTLRQKTTGQLMTYYWDYRMKAPATVQGDFSAIPPAARAPATP